MDPLPTQGSDLGTTSLEEEARELSCMTEASKEEQGHNDRTEAILALVDPKAATTSSNAASNTPRQSTRRIPPASILKGSATPQKTVAEQGDLAARKHKEAGVAKGTIADLPTSPTNTGGVFGRILAAHGGVPAATLRHEESTGDSVPGAHAQHGVGCAARARDLQAIEDGRALNDVSAASDSSFLACSCNLAVANPVVGETSTSDLPQAEEWSTSDTPSTKPSPAFSWTCKALLAAIACLVVPVILVTLAVTSSYNSGSEVGSLQGQEEVESSPQGQSPEQYLISVLPQYTLKELEDSESPQAKAFEWLLGDPQTQSRDYQEWRVMQRFALATLYYSTGGDSTDGWVRNDNWLSYGHHECTWYLADPDDIYAVDKFLPVNLDLSICSEGRLRNLGLISNQLKGRLPPELGLLTDLKGISFRSNQLGGSLPSHLASLASLVDFDIINNEITGSIPTEFGLLGNMDGFFLLLNHLSGTIPTQLGAISTLRFLSADSNAITGPIPKEIAKITSLEMSHNLLSGTLPAQLAHMASTVTLWNNALTGTIPSELGIGHEIRHFAAGNNALSGSLPTQLGGMQNLQHLAFWGTDISGSMPSELGNLSNLQLMVLVGNSLSGTLPSQLGRLFSLAALSLDDNIITGTLPTQLGQAKALLVMQLSGNHLSGSIPSQFGYLLNTEMVDLSSNALSGSIPSELGHATAIQELRLDHNELTGSIPSSLGLLFHKGFSWINAYVSAIMHPPVVLHTMIPSGALSFSINSLEGPIPTEIALMKNLHSFSAERNVVTGKIPSQLGLLSRLEHLVLRSNALTGSISPLIGETLSLTTFDVANNSLTGIVQQGMSPCSVVSESGYIDLSGNHFSGTLPTECCSLNSAHFSFDCSDMMCGCDCQCQ